MEAPGEMLRADAEELVGSKGKHREDRTHYHWAERGASWCSDGVESRWSDRECGRRRE
jgi:hypothetical protein